MCIVEQIFKLSIYEKFTRKTFQKGSTKRATDSNQRHPEKAHAEFELARLPITDRADR